MNYTVTHSAVAVLDYVDQLGGTPSCRSSSHKVVSIHIVKCFLVQSGIPFWRLFYIDVESSNLVSACSICPESCLLVSELWVYTIFHSFQDNRVEDITWQRKQHDSSVVGAFGEMAFFGTLIRQSWFQSTGSSSSSQICLTGGNSSSTVVSTSTFNVFEGMSSGPPAFPFLDVKIAFLCPLYFVCHIWWGGR